MHTRLTAARERHPVSDLSDRMQRRRTICRPRGYCGPFINETYYSEFGHGWEGYGDCAECGDTVLVEPHRAREGGSRGSGRGSRAVRLADLPTAGDPSP